MTSRYVPGSWWAVVCDSAVVLLDPGAPADLVEAVWDAVAVGGGVPVVIRVLTARYGTDFAEIPPFAIAAPQGGGAAVAARGPVHLRVLASAGTTEVSGLNVTTWSERWEEDARAVEVRADGADGVGTGGVPGLPVRSGVVRAAAVWVPWAAGEEAPAPEPTQAAAPAPPVSGWVTGTVLATNPPAVAEATAFAPEEEWSPEPVRSADSTGATPATPEATMAEALDGMDHLWRTRLTTVEDAAVREVEVEAEGVTPSTSAPAAGSGARITEVPGMADPFEDDHDGQTILSSGLAAIRAKHAQTASSPPMAAPLSGPSVLARVCAGGHSNPPEASECRTCMQPLTADAVRVARPSLGRVRLTTGDVVALDAPLVLGRKPSVDRVVGGDVPRPVVVHSPTREISGTHLAIRLEEWHVLVTDLDSSNGTILRRPGQPPQRLQPRDPVLVRTGDVVDIGDGVELVFEDLP